MSHVPLHILAVCTGNICRSPAIERLLTARWPEPVIAASAGTRAVAGAPIAAPMAALLDDAGVPSGGFAARQLTKPLIDDADLILTATTDHRSLVVDIEPRAVRRTFTLLEFARSVATYDLSGLAAAGTPQRLAELIQHARVARPRLRLGQGHLNVPDPFRQSDEVYRDAFAMIAEAVSAIARAFQAS